VETPKDAARRWYKACHQELRDLFWESDPLGLTGAPEDEYDSIIDGVLSALVNDGNRNAVAAALRDGLLYMAGRGYSELAAEREARSLSAITDRIIDWWRSDPTRG
jgi:hypothetical protein